MAARPDLERRRTTGFKSFFRWRSPFRRASEDKVTSDKDPLGLRVVVPVTDAVADIVFIHGLGGSSRKTWSNTDDIFWPQEWLRLDEAFRDVRIHTFGYNSGFIKSNILDIQEFAKSLLEWISDYPDIPKDSKVCPP